jgi:peptidoglycan-N-acetylmuramic acid deacetylase
MKKFMLCFTSALVMLCVTCGFMLSGGAVDWGLTPNSNQTTPEAPKGGAEMLGKHGGIYVCNKDAEVGNKNVYFTFDLGYEAGFTAECLDILKEHGIKATFFLCGNYLQETELMERMIAEGHTIGNHTDKHKDLPRLGDDAIIKDIADFTEKFEAKYGETYKKKMTQFRPPQGRFDERTLKHVSDQGMKTVMWSIAIVDWGKTPINAEASAKKVASRLHPGAIILFHITNAGTPKMLRLLMPLMNEKGYSAGNFK